MLGSTHSVTQKAHFDSCVTKSKKIRCKIFYRKTYATEFRGFVYNIFSKVNHGKNICRLIQILVQFPFATSEKKLDHFHLKLNIRVASRVVERLKPQDIKKLRSF